MLECSPHCSAGCITNGPGKCDGQCDFGYGLTDDLECIGMFTVSRNMFTTHELVNLKISLKSNNESQPGIM